MIAQGQRGVSGERRIGVGPSPRGRMVQLMLGVLMSLRSSYARNTLDSIGHQILHHR